MLPAYRVSKLLSWLHSVSFAFIWPNSHNNSIWCSLMSLIHMDTDRLWKILSEKHTLGRYVTLNSWCSLYNNTWWSSCLIIMSENGVNLSWIADIRSANVRIASDRWNSSSFSNCRFATIILRRFVGLDLEADGVERYSGSLLKIPGTAPSRLLR